MFSETVAAPLILEDYRGKGGPHLAKIRGEFIRDGARSANKREYVNVRGWLERANTRINAGSVLGMRTHHEAGDNTLLVGGKLTSVSPEGTYEGLIANTETGKTLLTLIEGRYVSSVSLRGSQPKVEPMETGPDGSTGWVRVKDLELEGIDFTQSPGISFASVALAESKADEFVESFTLEAATCPCCNSSVSECTCSSECGSCDCHREDLRPNDGDCPTCDADCQCSGCGQNDAAGDQDDQDDMQLTCDCDDACPCHQGNDDAQSTETPYWERDFSAGKRKSAAKAGAALPDGSFPIYTQKDLDNAVRLYGNAKDPAAAKAHILKRAKSLGLTLPDSWQADTKKESASMTTLAEEINDAVETAKPNPKKQLTVESEPQGDIAAAVAEAIEDHNEAASLEEIGSKFSKSSKAEIQKAIDTLSALLPKAEDTDTSDSDDTQSDDSDEHTERAGTDDLTEAVINAARSATEKTVKRELKEFKKQLRDEFYTLRRKNRVEEDDEEAPKSLRKSAKIAESDSGKTLESEIDEMSLAEMLKAVLIHTQQL